MKAEHAWPEIWHTIKPLIENVLSGGASAWSEDQLIPIYRNGQLEDVYWTFSYSAVNDETGRPAGVFVTCTETTEKVNSIRKLEASKNEFQYAIDATELGTFDYNPVTGLFTANDRLKEWFGLLPHEEIAFDNAINVIAAKDRERVKMAVQQALDFKSGGLYDTEYITVHPVTGKETPVRAKGRTWFGEHRNAYRFTGTLQDISEQVSIRRQVEESEKRFRTVADSAPALIWMAGADTLYNFFNKAWLDFTGSTMEHQKGNGWHDGIHPDDFQRCLDVHTAAFHKREVFYVEYRLKRHDGAYRWISDNGTPRFRADGMFEGYIGACMDINDTVTTQQRLKENEERLHVVIEASELGTWELNLKTDEVIYTNRYLEIFGYKKDTDRSHVQFLEFLHPDDRMMRDIAFEQGLATGILQYESRIRWEDASLHWIEVKGKVFYDEEKQPLKILGTLRDITEEKNFQQGLLDSEQKFRLLADSMPQFVWTGDAAGNLNYFNRAVYQYAGLTEEQILNGGWMEIVHPEERDENMRRWRAAVHSGSDFTFEHRFRRHDGEYRWQLSRAIPQRDNAGKIQMWVGSSTDIQELKELDQQKDYFISVASHELKTPVTSIKGYIQILQKMYSNTADAFLKNSLMVADKQIVTLTRLITDLLDLSKIKTGSLSLNKESFELDALVADTINGIKTIHPDHNINFTGKTNSRVYADRERISQVLINFLTNAVKYSPLSLAITVTGIIKDGQAVVQVKDGGIGIQKKDQEKIFERFYRVEGKNEKTFPGFGIGLFIAAEIISRHNGNIGVVSDPGAGSNFYFSLPLNT